MPSNKIQINRAPVLALWAAVVAHRLGHGRATALTLGKALAGLNAQSKGRRLGIYEAKEKDRGEKKEAKAPSAAGVPLMGREIPASKTGSGWRATHDGKPMDPESVQRYLEQKFGDHLGPVEAAMEKLATAYSPAELEVVAFALYEKFRPGVPEGKKGWGAKGELNISLITSMAKTKSAGRK